MSYIGDFRAGTTVNHKWASNDAAGASITRATNGSIRIYKGSSTTERSSATGITDTEDHDSLTGVHHVTIDLSSDADAGFYAAGNDYFVVLAAATIDGETVNHPLFSFSIENRSALMPTTAGRTVDVTAGGTVGVDLANVEAPTTTLNLSGTTIKTATDVETDTADIQSRIGSPGVSLTADLATIDSNIDTLLTRIPNTLSLANINSEMDTALGDYNGPTHAELISEINAVQSDIAALNNLASADVAAAVWNAARASYGSAGSYGETLEEWADGGRLDLLLDAALADTNELQGDWANGGRLDLLLDAALADTNELQGDWANGGRLDLILDARASQTSVDTIDSIVDAIVADTSTDGVVLSAAMLNKIADHVLRRRLANARASSDGDTLAFRSLLGAGSKLVNKVAISGTSLQVFDETDTGTPFGTQELTSDAAAAPITGVDTD